MLASTNRKSIHILFITTWLSSTSSAFQSPPSFSRSKSDANSVAFTTLRKQTFQCASTTSTTLYNSNDEDLFEYFDPRLSPHEYPNGIAADDKSVDSKNEEDEDRLNPFGITPGGGSSASFQETTVPKPTSSSSSTADDLFDPRISPHEYPNGVPKAVVDAAAGATSSFTTPPPSLSSQPKQQKTQQDVFDPRLSPHDYPNGTPPTIGYASSSTTTTTLSSFTTQKIGILLIDHGSKREKSNLHLEGLAQVYQAQCNNNGDGKYEYVVKAAHMEIAAPSIEDGMNTLIEEGVGKIICHPYFLSPGKHATKDIPNLISSAITSINKPHIPVVTTDPVGTKLNVMVNAIHGLVEECLETLEEDVSGVKKKNEWELGGFFGDVKRMLEEEEG